MDERRLELVGSAPVPTLAQCTHCGADNDLEACVRCGKPVCPRCRGTWDDAYVSAGEQRGHACAPCLASGEVHEAGPLRRFGRIATQLQRIAGDLRADGERLAVGVRTEVRDVLLPEVRHLEEQARALVREGLWGSVDRLGWWITVIVLLALLFR